MKAHLVNDWLRDLILPGGALYYDKRTEKTRKIIEQDYNGLMQSRSYSHSKLLSEMEFGVWKYMYNYVFGELDYINNLRNRIAHHEPICFGNPVCIDTSYVQNRYNRIMELFRWMDIDGTSLLYGLGRVDNACNQIDRLLKQEK